MKRSQHWRSQWGWSPRAPLPVRAAKSAAPPSTPVFRNHRRRTSPCKSRSRQRISSPRPQTSLSAETACARVGQPAPSPSRPVLATLDRHRARRPRSRRHEDHFCAVCLCRASAFLMRTRFPGVLAPLAPLAPAPPLPSQPPPPPPCFWNQAAFPAPASAAPPHRLLERQPPRAAAPHARCPSSASVCKANRTHNKVKR